METDGEDEGMFNRSKKTARTLNTVTTWSSNKYDTGINSRGLKIDCGSQREKGWTKKK